MSAGGATPRRTASTLRVRYAETDRMGVVYHTHYLVWCEVGRTDYIRELGTSYAELERQGYRLAVAHAEIRYLAPARYDDLVRVETWLERVRSRAVTFGYEIAAVEAEASRLLATATTTMIALDPDGSPRSLPSALLERFRDAIAPR